MTDFQKACIVWVAIVVALIALALVLSGCQSLRKGEDRKITAWGIWAVPFGAPIGVGYWHSERGDDVKSEESAKPGIPDGLNSLKTP